LIFAISLGPFIYSGQIWNLKSRLFPFQRGLTHAYWACNFWAIYNFTDVFISFLMNCRSSTTLGLVNEISFNWLPNVTPFATFIITILTMLPALIQLARYPHPRIFLFSFNSIFLCSFLFGWHVHEKAILISILPLSLLALESVQLSKLFLFVSIVGHFALFPLIFTNPEQPLVLILYILYTLISYLVLYRWHSYHTQLKRRIQFRGFFNRFEWIYLCGLPFLYFFQHVVVPFIPAFARFQFLPLMLISVYCAFGTLYALYLITVLTHHAIQALDIDLHES
jgi:alpha-1,3-glucosyltransferase